MLCLWLCYDNWAHTARTKTFILFILNHFCTCSHLNTEQDANITLWISYTEAIITRNNYINVCKSNHRNMYKRGGIYKTTYKLINWEKLTTPYKKKIDNEKFTKCYLKIYKLSNITLTNIVCVYRSIQVG